MGSPDTQTTPPNIIPHSNLHPISAQLITTLPSFISLLSTTSPTLLTTAVPSTSLTDPPTNASSKNSCWQENDFA